MHIPAPTFKLPVFWTYDVKERQDAPQPVRKDLNLAAVKLPKPVGRPEIEFIELLADPGTFPPKTMHRPT